MHQRRRAIEGNGSGFIIMIQTTVDSFSSSSKDIKQASALVAKTADAETEKGNCSRDESSLYSVTLVTVTVTSVLVF